MIRSSRTFVLDIVLAAYPAQKLLGVETGRVDGGIDEYLHQRSHDLVTRQLDVERACWHKSSFSKPECR